MITWLITKLRVKNLDTDKMIIKSNDVNQIKETNDGDLNEKWNLPKLGVSRSINWGKLRAKGLRKGLWLISRIITKNFRSRNFPHETLTWLLEYHDTHLNSISWILWRLQTVIQKLPRQTAIILYLFVLNCFDLDNWRFQRPSMVPSAEKLEYHDFNYT